jgi:uncharacterized protein YcgI (DUF1989 family)
MVRTVEVPAGGGAACIVRRGELLRVVDPEGQQVADFNAWSLADPRERFWSARPLVVTEHGGDVHHHG